VKAVPIILFCVLLIVAVDGFAGFAIADDRKEVVEGLVGGGMIIGLTIGIFVGYSNASNLVRHQPNATSGAMGVLLGIPTIIGGTWLLGADEELNGLGAVIVVIGATSTILGSTNLFDSIGARVRGTETSYRLFPAKISNVDRSAAYGIAFELEF
jgi:hypothetical protein